MLGDGYRNHQYAAISNKYRHMGQTLAKFRSRREEDRMGTTGWA